jgi:predicted dehydrogenase
VSPDRPQSIAIAGAWGYIGLKFTQAAMRLGMRVFVYDPAPRPDTIAPDAVEVITSEEEFYRLPADLFHLALHPGHRAKGLGILFDRAKAGEDLLVLNEKPMAPPEKPDHCRAIMEAVEGSTMVLFYDFLELFDPMTARIKAFLRGFDAVRVDEVNLYRSKDREDPDNPRNYKVMVPIQYQETVHCVAFLLSVLGCRSNELDRVFDPGLSVSGVSQLYRPPNPEHYPYPVDGQCDGTLEVGPTTVHLHTDFKTGAELTKRRSIRGVADGSPFLIEADYLEGAKYLVIDGVPQDFPADSPSYEQAIRQVWTWYRNLDKTTLNSCAFPNPRFAWKTYLISAMLWDSCQSGQQISASSPQDLAAYAPRFPHGPVPELAAKK